MVTVAVFLGSLLGAMALGMPIAFALLVCGVSLMLLLGVFDANIVAENLINGADSFPLMAVPFFLLAGEFMNAGGLSRRIIAIGVSLLGHVRGGLGYVAIVSAIVLASLSGSAVADTAALAAVLVPMMRTAGYDVPRACGLMAAGGIIAPVIPPSIGFIVFGVAANVSITHLFLAGIAPGVLMGASLAIAWWWVSSCEYVKPYPRQSWSVRARELGRGAWALGLPVLIIGGLKFGIFTPTEAGVVAAVYALVVGMFVYRELRPSQLYGAILEAGKATGVIMFLVAAAGVSAWLITIANIPAQLGSMLQPLIAHQTLLMVAMMTLVLVVGTALDFVPTVLILTPVLMPIVKQAGIDPVYFGVLFIINNAIGLITPPVGVVLNVVCGVARIDMDSAIRGVWPFLIAETLALALLIIFPQIVTAPLGWLR
jgi:tripartite ATP-independent transporter DctM subunit